MTYDANNKMTAFAATGVSVATKYDAEGRRVRKVHNGQTTVWVYDAFGKLAAEYTTAVSTDTGVYYRTTDHLGSTRVVTDDTAAVKSRLDYFPFGEQLDTNRSDRGAVQDAGATTYNAAAGMRQKFTGQERDDETDLDYFKARNYHPCLAQFLSKDPSNRGARAGYPQTWNGYSYVVGNAPNRTDPTGEFICIDPECLQFDEQDLPPSTPSAPYMCWVDGQWISNAVLCSIIPQTTLSHQSPGTPAPITFKHVSQSGEHQNIIWETARALEEAFSGEFADSDCAKWLGGGEQVGLLGGSLVFAITNVTALSGSAEFIQSNGMSNAATGTGVQNTAVLYNTHGAFFRTNVGVGDADVYRREISALNGHSDRARAFIMIHELAHSLVVPGFLSDGPSLQDAAQSQRGNNDMIWQHCGDVLKSFSNDRHKSVKWR